MADYISREAAWNGIYNCPTKTDADGYIWVRTKDVAHMIDEIPAADVRSVKHGEWIVDDPGEYQLIECDQCHAQMWNHQSELPNYCYECGSDMRPERGTKE